MEHPFAPDLSFDGGDLDCGGGLLLLIRRHIDPLEQGSLLEILSTDSTVEADLPSWCRLTGNELVSVQKEDGRFSFLVCKGPLGDRTASARRPVVAVAPPRFRRVEVTIPDRLPTPAPVAPIRPFSVMGIGSWPRPRWMVRAIHDRLEGRLDEAEFHEIADDAVELAVAAQTRAGVDLISDGEQRRDSYASFVGALLDNTQLIPLSDLAAMVDDPEKFEAELRALDVPAREVRHPVVFGRLGRSRPLAVHELESLRRISDRPAKVALPGPYLLTRTMWLDCLDEMPQESREELADEVVRVLREELHHLLAAGAAIVQFDEPVLTEVVFGGATRKRSFMCGALSERGAPDQELDFAVSLLNRVVDGLPRERCAVHVCRGNWTKDESALLSGDYRSLRPYLEQVRTGILFLEFSTPRAGEIAALAEMRLDQRIGLGCLNPRCDEVESPAEILRRAEEATALFGPDRLLLNSDCGFATFADNPVASARVAEAKLRNLALAAASLRERHGV
ncbi:MAG: sulfurtransferase TusA family protein [Planctomycetes bacterium]|nr:sulfurtransferase TusA family protein [Planctomycetota bacterium]